MSGVIVALAIILFVILIVRIYPSLKQAKIQKQADLGMYDVSMSEAQAANQAVANDNAPISYYVDSEWAKAMFNNTVDETFKPFRRMQRTIANRPSVNLNSTIS